MDTNSHILIIDDNQENLRVVTSYLKEEGYKIALALNGKNGLDILKKNPVDLILLDIMMPNMDGFEVCKAIKEIPEAKDIPVIFLTAKTETEDIVKGFQTGGVDYITKPFNREELLVRVKNQLDLARSKKKILEMNRTRDKLYSIIAHDIRSPLSSIQQTIYGISEGHIDVNSNVFKETIGHLRKQTNDTYTLLNNLLEWSKVQNGEIRVVPQCMPVHPILKECLDLLEGNANNKNIGITLDVPENAKACFDEVTIHTVFRNLISNAIKFTPANGKISIESKPEKDYLDIFVRDSGVGMPDEVIEKVFEKNEPYTSIGTDNEKGSGVGLFMVKELLKKNKGSIHVENSTDKGTSIKVSLPLTKTE